MVACYDQPARSNEADRAADRNCRQELVAGKRRRQSRRPTICGRAHHCRAFVRTGPIFGGDRAGVRGPGPVGTRPPNLQPDPCDDEQCRPRRHRRRSAAGDPRRHRLPGFRLSLCRRDHARGVAVLDPESARHISCAGHRHLRLDLHGHSAGTHFLHLHDPGRVAGQFPAADDRRPRFAGADGNHVYRRDRRCFDRRPARSVHWAGGIGDRLSAV